MKRRPVCLVCLLLMFCIWLMDLAGFARISGNPLPESVQLYIEKHPEAVICGEVQQYQATEYSLSAYLKHVWSDRRIRTNSHKKFKSIFKIE